MRLRSIVSAGVLAGALAGAAWAKGGAGGAPAPTTGIDIAVENSAGKPVEMASVLVLGMGGSDMMGNWLIGPRPLLTNTDGHVQWPSWTNHACFYAWKDDDAAFECGVALSSRPAQHRIRLVPARRLQGNVLGSDGKPAADARVRLAIAGAQEWHHLGGEVSRNGKLTFPPVPPDVLQHPDTHVEARLAGCVEARVLVEPGKPVEVRFVASRRIHGTVKAEGGVRAAVVQTSDYWHGPKAAVEPDGAFSLEGLSSDVRRVYVVSKSHAPLLVDLPDSKSDIDLGTLTVERGRAVRGTIAGLEGGKGGELTVGLLDDRGVGVDWQDTDVRAAFDFPHVGAGIDRLAARVGGTGGELWIFDRGKLEGDLTPPPFSVVFENAGGSRQLVETATIVWSSGDRKETVPVRMFSYTLGVATVRLRLPGSGSLRVEIAGAPPVTVDHVDVDAEGRGSARIQVSR